LLRHQVLARKWRPGCFEDLVGQTHVVRALTHALASQRLHHAYLFSGTRGVGKTTLGRILAKCLNCETGITPTPCGQCRSCREIAEGRHLDLLEVDAASRTRVDDTRELLDNCAYAPVSGRFKIYLIDEVHMLSDKSFNALLKTLEEPPGHVKFLLATTDPQKLPVTVLSRCLQFTLKPVPVVLMAEYLGRVLMAEGIPAERGALLRLAEAADGSLRDALSLTDQAIAYGGGGLVEAEVCDMIGLLPQSRLQGLLDDLWSGRGTAMLETIQALETLAPDWSRLLEELARLVHGIAVDQILQQDASVAGQEALRVGEDALRRWQWETAGRESPEEIQLAYQILVQGLRDLPYAPDPRVGAEMTLLRLLAFRPLEWSAPTVHPKSAPAVGSGTAASPGSSAGASPSPPAVGLAPPSSARLDAEAPLDWHAFAERLPAGPDRELALQAEWVAEDRVRGRLHLQVSPAHWALVTERRKRSLAERLSQALGREVQVEFKAVSAAGQNAPAVRLQAEAQQRQSSIEERLRADPIVQAVQEYFGAEIGAIHVQEHPK
jgi:DNA polymerase-3 subunit gamma/tau